MSSTLKVDATKFKKDLKSLGKTANKSAANAVKVAIRQANAFYMSFDDVESVPWIKDSDGMITISGAKLAGEAESAEEVLAVQTQAAALTMQQTLQEGLKGVCSQ